MTTTQIKKLAIFFVIAVSTAGLFANETPLIAVFDLEANRVEYDDMRSIAELISSSLFETGRYAVLDTSRRDELLNELNFSLSGLTDEKSKLEAGKLLSAEYILTGSFSLVGGRYLLTLKILNTESSLTTHSTSGSWDSLPELIDSIDTLVKKLTADGKNEQQETEVMAEAAREAAEEKEKSPSFSLNNEKVLVWGLAGGGAVAITAGAVLLLSGLSQYDDAYSTYNDKETASHSEWDTLWADVEDAAELRRAYGITGLSLITAGTAMAGYAVWRHFNPPKSTENGGNSHGIEQLYFAPLDKGVVLGGHLKW